MTIYTNGDIVAEMKTSNGVIKIVLETQLAPRTTTNFIGLAKKGYYDGIIFHRIIKGFMIQ
jgi:peptidylprolyl isomerase